MRYGGRTDKGAPITEETKEKYRTLHDDGAITREELEEILAASQADETAQEIQKMQRYCYAVMAGAALMAVLSLLYTPPDPAFPDFSKNEITFIAYGFLYLLTKGTWCSMGPFGGGVIFFFALYADWMFRKATDNDAPHFRKAKDALRTAAGLLLLCGITQSLIFIFLLT